MLRKALPSVVPTSTSNEQAVDPRSFPIKGAELALPSLRVAIAVSLAYFTAAIFCINLAGEANNIASLWLPNAIGLVALLRHRPAVWPILLLLQGIADLSANVLMGSTLPAALGVAAADMLEVLLVAAALHWSSDDKPWFISPRWMLVFAVASVCATAAAAFLGTGWLFLLGQETAFDATWRIWFVADTLGLIVVTPLLLSWTEKTLKDEFTWSRLLEVGLLISIMALIIAFAFSLKPGSLSFLVFPFLMIITLPRRSAWGYGGGRHDGNHCHVAHVARSRANCGISR
jgi:integral membrane sensor domain MASE1